MRTIIVFMFAASVAHADGRIEIGGAVGGHAFSTTSELGVDDDMTMPGATSSIAIGARGGFLVLPQFAVEAEALAIPTKGGDAGALALGVRAHARYDILRGRIVPFVLAGGGMHVVTPGSALMGDADQALHWGGGARYALDRGLELRLDARHLIVPDRTLNGATSDFEVTAGVTYRFDLGGARPARAVATTPAAAPADRDLDTIPDASDKCPLQPEDVDSFEDADGCPELDNDKDGVADADDICPTDKETKNNFRDEDGCPDQVIGELAAIQFEQDSTKLDPAADPLVDRAAKQLAEFPGLSVEISGHTAGEANAMDLSLRRAEVVKAALIKRGVAASRILTVGHGADKPLPDRRKSRRIEFRMLTPDEVL